MGAFTNLKAKSGFPQVIKEFMSTQLAQSNQITPPSMDSLFTDLLDNYQYPEPQRGEIITGEVMRIEQDAVFIDVGSKREAIVPYEEVQQLEEKLLKSLDPGDKVHVYVTHTPRGDDELIVSLEKGLQELDWKRAEEVERDDQLIELKALKHNKGGLMVEFGRIQGFIPNSHLPFLRGVRDRQEQAQIKAAKIGEMLPVKLIQLDREKQNLVFSATQGMVEKRLSDLILGEVVTGKVVNFKPYGAFVDIGDGVIGLIHISNIDWSHIEHPSECLSRGEELKVKIDDINLDKQQISLNRKALLPRPEQE